MGKKSGEMRLEQNTKGFLGNSGTSQSQSFPTTRILPFVSSKKPTQNHTTPRCQLAISSSSVPHSLITWIMLSMKGFAETEPSRSTSCDTRRPNLNNTVDGWNPAPPEMYPNTVDNGVFTIYELLNSPDIRTIYQQKYTRHFTRFRNPGCVFPTCPPSQVPPLHRCREDGPQGEDLRCGKSGEVKTWWEIWRIITLPKFNITPENDGLEDVFPFPRGAFSGSMLIFQDVFINGFPGVITPSFSPYYLGEFLLIWGQLLKWW